MKQGRKARAASVPPLRSPTVHITMRVSDMNLMERICAAHSLNRCDFIRRLFDFARQNAAPLLRE